jgi:hypothetical protein
LSDRGAGFHTSPATSASDVRKLSRVTVSRPQASGWTRVGAILPRVVDSMLEAHRPSPTWSAYVDLCLEVQRLREQLAVPEPVRCDCEPCRTARGDFQPRYRPQLRVVNE